MEENSYIFSVISPGTKERLKPFILLSAGGVLVVLRYLNYVPKVFAQYMTIFGILLAVTALISAYYTLERTGNAKKCLARLSEKAELKRAASELSDAMEENEKLFEKKTVLLTEHYVISPKMGVAVNYNDITELNCVAANHRVALSFVDGISLKTNFAGWITITSQKTPSRQLISLCMAIEENNPELKQKAFGANN